MSAPCAITPAPPASSAPDTFTVVQFTRLHRLGALIGQPWARTPLERYLYFSGYAEVEGQLLREDLLTMARSAEEFPVLRGRNCGVTLQGEELRAVVFRSGAAKVSLHRPGEHDHEQGFWLPKKPAGMRRLLGDALDLKIPFDEQHQLLEDAYMAILGTDLDTAFTNVCALFSLQ